MADVSQQLRDAAARLRGPIPDRDLAESLAAWFEQEARAFDEGEPWLALARDMAAAINASSP